MFNIDPNTKTIELSRGDNAKFKMRLFYPNGHEHFMVNSDSVVLVVKETVAGTVKLTKNMEITDKCFYIQPSDTANLAPGDYIYDVRITENDYKTYTVVGPAKFRILPTLQNGTTAPNIII